MIYKFFHNWSVFLTVTTVLLAFSVQTANSQVGLRVISGGGVNLAEGGDILNPDETPVFNGGVGLQLDLNDAFSLNLDVQAQFLSIEGDFLDLLEDDFELLETFPYGASYFNLNPQVYAKYTSSFREIIPPYHFRAEWEFFFLAGGFFNYGITSESLVDAGDFEDPDTGEMPLDAQVSVLGAILPMFQDIDFGPVVGTGIQYNPTQTSTFALDVRYMHGLNNMAGGYSDDQIETMEQMGMAGFLPDYEAYSRVIGGNLSYRINF